MQRSLLLAALVAALLAFAAASLAPLTQEYAEARYEANEFGVILHVSEDRIAKHRQWLEKELREVDDGSALFKFYSIGQSFRAYTGRFTPRMLNRIRAQPEVELVDRNVYAELYAVQTNAPWGLDRVDQRNLPLSTTYVYPDTAGRNVDVYVVDTGVRISHQDFGGRAVFGVTTPRDSDQEDHNGHGTHVASTIGGTTYGIAKAARIIAVKVMKDSGVGTVFDITDGIDWVAAQHRNSTTKKSVANMSLGSPIPNPFISRASAALIEEGVILVVAAGNSDKDACRSDPAGVETAITVGSTDEYDARSYFSNWGPCVDVFAPGSNITAAWFTGDADTNTISGTSMASPHGAGVVALYLALASYTPAQMHAKIIEVATKGVLSDIDPTSPNALLYNSPPALF